VEKVETNQTNFSIEKFFCLGETISERDRCKTCIGKKTVDQKKKLEVVISPGEIPLLSYRIFHYEIDLFR